MESESLNYIFLILILAAVLIWAVVATLSVRTWSQHCQEIERVMAEVPGMRPVLEALPRHSEDHRLVAAIVEPRTHRNLIPAIRNVQQVLRGTPIRVFHGNLNRGMLLEAFGAEIAADAVRLIPLAVDNFNIEQYNLMMTSPRFYEACDGCHVLVFQTDSVLFSKSRVRLDEFLEYDYVGAVWPDGGEASFRAWCFRSLPPSNKIGNGGLSLRRRAKMIEAVAKIAYLSTPFINEDVYFGHSLPELDASLPSAEQSKRFSYEQVIGKELPFGAHKYLPKAFDHQISDLERSIIENRSEKPA